MVSKKKRFGDDEIPVFNDGCIYKRGDYWHFRLWLRDENKYARKSLNTTNRSTAIERGEAFYLELRANQQIGKKYFSLTAKEGVRLYLEHREKDIAVRSIVKGRHGTITTHLNHWLDFIGRDTKLKDLGRTACESYFSERMAKAKRELPQAPRKTLRTILRSFRQFSREFVRLIRLLLISNELCEAKSMERRMTRLRFRRLHRRLPDEREAQPKPEIAP